jgi:hypothetical protein
VIAFFFLALFVVSCNDLLLLFLFFLFSPFVLIDVCISFVSTVLDNVLCCSSSHIAMVRPV